VGFIQKLPTQLVAAFRATLEELEEATLLLHVVDITHADAEQQARTVDDTVRDLGLGERPRLLALNKVDVLVEEGLDPANLDLPAWAEGGLVVSAEKRWGLEELREAIEAALAEAAERKRLATAPTANNEATENREVA
jgi:GTP-binding protein HflX